MKKLIYIFFILISILEVSAQNNIYNEIWSEIDYGDILYPNRNIQKVWLINANTNSWPKKEEGVVITIRGTYITAHFVSCDWNFWDKQYWSTYAAGFKTFEKQIVWEEPFEIDLSPFEELTIEINSTFYKPKSLYYKTPRASTITIKDELFNEVKAKDKECHYELKYVNQNNWSFEFINLVPEKTLIEGNLNIKSESTNQSTNQSTTDLGLLTTGTIAKGLGISENDVIKLITSGQLKGKKIGDNYFVRKEDFDIFMKK